MVDVEELVEEEVELEVDELVEELVELGVEVEELDELDDPVVLEVVAVPRKN